MQQFDAILMGALSVAQSQAMERKHLELSPEHLLYGLIKNPASFSSRALKKYLKNVEDSLKKLPATSGQVSLEQLRPSHMFSQWLTLAQARATEKGRREVNEGDLLRYITQALPQLNISPEDLQLSENGGAEGEVEQPDFLINLNELAEAGKLDPVIGRNKEIRAVMEVLGRRSKNNPVLVGPAGVGKTAIVEGLADMIIKGTVPDFLKDKVVFSMEMGRLMAGTKYRGDFEEKIQTLLKFIKSRSGEAVLFIDEIHQLVGAGRTDGAMDAANLLKPALARGELHCIGATTPEEYQKYILNDSALDRRFRPVRVDEPSKEDAIEILMGVKEKQEMHHGIKISDEAIYSSVMLSDQYITDKNLPDKAIDLIDEAAAALKLSAQALPAELVELESEIRSKLIYSKVEKNNQEILKEVEQLQKKFNAGKQAWEKEILTLKQLANFKNQLDRLKFDLEAAERKQNYEEASKIKYLLIPQVQKELERISPNWVLQPYHVAQVISRQTGIPVEKILKSKQDRVLELEKFLNERVFGQDQALHEIAETILMAHAGLSAENRPLGSFLLLGPTGVGKTESAKSVAQFLFSSEKRMVRLDMSEYSEKHAVAKLIGAPAGYVGYEEGGILTEAIRKHPYSVILLDELEKAHPDFSDILLQILDDGRLTDNKGRTISFKNTIIFMTSNSKDVQRDFKPEVLGRINEMLYFKPIDNTVMERLVQKQVRELNERLKSKKLTVKIDHTLLEILATRGYVPDFGARPLQSVFNKIVVRPLSKMVLQNELLTGKVILGWKDEHLTLHEA